MPKKSFFQLLSIIISITICISFTAVGQANILDENGKETGLINVNPDPNGETWIAGGITKAAWEASITKLPEFQITGLGTRPLAPDKVDNTQSDAFRPIFNQEGGSCAQASSIGYVFTYEINTARGLAATTLKNQYPYDFTYNFCNSGSGSNGSMPSQGFDIAVKLGIPDADAYGGFGLGDHDRWVSGYDVYFNGMANRSSDQFTISVGTEAGINTMREWLDNHGNGSADGGCLAFCYDCSGCNTVSLATGTPEAGKKAIVEFGSGGGHAVSIGGYNDSVRYDYNNDGQYTNNLDINGDRAVDVTDWEIGAVIMVNSWGTSFGDNGKIYVMYRMCADPDGMWSKRVYGMNVDEEYVKPQLTFKTTIEHSARNDLEIRAGISNNISATTPSETISFGKAFDNAGGAYPMGGSGVPSIEIGLDATLLLDEMTGKEAKFFLQIKSNGNGSGQVETFSILDYTSGSPIETVCDQQNVDISSSSTYYLSIVLSGTPRIVVTSPNGGELWEQFTGKDIAWGDNIDGNVKIELLKGGSVAETIASSTESDGIFTWDIPEDYQTGTDFKIRVSSVDSAALFDESDENFSITEEYVIACPYFQNFDTLTAKSEILPFKYDQLATDDHNWTVYSGPTPSRIDDPPDVTGPMADHTTGQDGNYLYTEASASADGNPNKEFDFTTPKFDFNSIQNPELTFYYHMLSDNAGEDHMGEFSLDINVDGTWHSDVIKITGNQGDNWLEKKLDLTPYKGDRVILRFRAVTGDSWESDICIDDLRIDPSTPIVNGITNVSSSYDLTFHNSRIYFKVPESAAKGKVQVRLYNLHGKLIKTLANSNLDAGSYSVPVHDLATGLYLCRMEAGGIKKTINVMLY